MPIKFCDVIIWQASPQVSDSDISSILTHREVSLWIRLDSLAVNPSFLSVREWIEYNAWNSTGMANAVIAAWQRIQLWNSVSVPVEIYFRWYMQQFSWSTMLRMMSSHSFGEKLPTELTDVKWFLGNIYLKNTTNWYNSFICLTDISMGSGRRLQSNRAVQR